MPSGLIRSRDVSRAVPPLWSRPLPVLGAVPVPRDVSPFPGTPPYVGLRVPSKAGCPVPRAACPLHDRVSSPTPGPPTSRLYLPPLDASPTTQISTSLPGWVPLCSGLCVPSKTKYSNFKSSVSPPGMGPPMLGPLQDRVFPFLRLRVPSRDGLRVPSKPRAGLQPCSHHPLMVQVWGVMGGVPSIR